MLKEGDADEEVVHPDVRPEVYVDHKSRSARPDDAPRPAAGKRTVAGNVLESEEVGRNREPGKEESDPDVGHDDLRPVTLVKDDGVRVKVVGALGVLALAGRVLDKVRLPAKQLLDHEVAENVERGVTDGLAELSTTGRGDVDAGAVLLGLVEGGVTLQSDKQARQQAGTGSVRQILQRTSCSRVRGT